MEEAILIHFGELFLKGRNRDWFLKKLAENIKKTCGGTLEKKHSYFVLKSPNWELLKYVPGISWYAKCFRTQADLKSIKKVLKQVLKNASPKSFKLKVKRSDKTFPLTSTEIEKQLGEELEKKLNLKAELINPNLTLYVEIQKKEAFVYTEKIKGIGGLPVSTSGKGLVLFSGGIDSPVAAFLMMKRGMHVDLVHFHVFTKAEKLEKTKIFDLSKTLAWYQTKIRLYAVPYYIFQLKALELESNELILFRRFMLKVAEKIAIETGAKALITGDSLGQVASQTLDNLFVTTKAVSLPVLRPLIGLDKEEIINIARRIGTYESSIKEYKDCCSIITKRAKTRTRKEVIEEVEKKLNVEGLIKQTMPLVEVFDFRVKKGRLLIEKQD